MKRSQSFLFVLFSSTSWLTRFIVLFATLCICFGFFGWYAQRDNLELSFGDVLYRAITGVTFIISFDEASDWNSDWRLEIARWSGVLMLIAAASKTLLYLVGDHWRRRSAESRRDHWMIIGDSSFANRLSDAAAQQALSVNRLCCGDTLTQPSVNGRFVDTRPWSIENAIQLGLTAARGIVVAASDDSTTRNIAYDVRRALPEHHQQAIVACLESGWLSMRIDELDGLNGIRVTSEAQVAVQGLLAKHPLFLLAHKHNQKRIHVVIVNFSPYGEAVLVETLLSSLTTDLKKPVFTIVDPDASTIQHTLNLRYPELSQSAQINYVNGQLAGDSHILAAGTIEQSLNTSPVTAVFCCAENDNQTLKTALLSQTLILKHPDCGAAIFCRQQATSISQQPAAGVAEISSGQIISFGTADELVNDTGLFSDAVDEMARAFHLAYQSKAAGDKPGNVPWEELTEDLRESNRRIAVHIPAKLHSMGADVEHWLTAAGDGLQRLPGTTTESLTFNADAIESLAKLEHDRWMADRRINGWTYGEKRNNDGRIHPDLMAYDRLSEASKNHDREIVISLFKVFGIAKTGDIL